MFRKFCYWLVGRIGGVRMVWLARGGGSGDSRSPPGKRSNTMCSPTSSKTSPNRFQMSDLQVEEVGE